MAGPISIEFSIDQEIDARNDIRDRVSGVLDIARRRIPLKIEKADAM